MTLPDSILEIGAKLWIAVVVPISAWLYKWQKKKREEYNSLVVKVGALEGEVKHINSKIDEDREERKRTSNKIDHIHELIIDLSRDTASNKARLEERKRNN